MTELPLITIALPAYNHAKFVVQALDSTLDSGLPRVEVLICDDASTDGTPELIETWAENNASRLERFSFVRHKRNTGAGVAMNELIADARGEIIHGLASDDFYLPGGLEKKTKAMLEHPEWMGAFCDGQAVGPDGQVFVESLMDHGSLNPSRLTSADMAEELFYQWQEPANLLSWRRRAFRVHGGQFEYDSTVFCEDFDFAWWALGRGALGYVPAVCYGYRCRTWPQTSNRNPTREWRDIAHILARHAPSFPAGLAGRMRRRALGLYYSAAGDEQTAAPFHREYENDTAAHRASGQKGNSTQAPLNRGEIEAEIKKWRTLAKDAKRDNKQLKEKLKSLSGERKAQSAEQFGKRIRRWWRRLRGKS